MTGKEDTPAGGAEKGEGFFLDREGRWFHKGVEVTHKRTLALFFRSLSRGPDGRYFVTVSRDRAVVELEDTPFLVTSVTVNRDDKGVPNTYTLFLNDGTNEPLDPRTLSIRQDNVMYCTVKNGTDEARFLRPAYYQVCAHIQPGEPEGRYILPWMSQNVQIAGTPQAAPSEE